MSEQDDDGRARMAAARLHAYGPEGLTAGDVAALVLLPDQLPAGYSLSDLPADAPEKFTGPTGAQRAGSGFATSDEVGKPVLPQVMPDMDGATYRRHADYVRLGAQARRVWDAMSDGAWHTLAELATITGDPEASISARLRDFRKESWGGHTVEHARAEPGGGTWVYRLGEAVVPPA
ncbi:MAG: hypothetical protein SHS37scaffold145_41 [Phage 71_18]|nr:MAG: hypothetical protein SHS37scaffold145_41 [Phage 71_18]